VGKRLRDIPPQVEAVTQDILGRGKSGVGAGSLLEVLDRFV